jgi:23S rRNA pseudouridine1911/1915/1917 synthase
MKAHEVLSKRTGRLDAVLAKNLPELSRSRLAALIRAGAVTVDGVVIDRPAARAFAGSTIRVEVPDPTPDTAIAQDLPLSIVYQDADLAVIDKAAGMVVHPSAGHADGTLVNALLHHLTDLSGIGGTQRPGIVHRLDRGTSGLLVVAKNDHAHHHLAGQFAAHTAGRTYLALVLGVPVAQRGTITSQLARHPTDRKRWASTTPLKGKRAVTHWERLQSANTMSLLACRLETGRTHQIRVHLTEQGWPLLGDPVYKRNHMRPPVAIRPLVQPDRPMLHAWQLAFEHPTTGASMTHIAEPPADFTAITEALGITP